MNDTLGAISPQELLKLLNSKDYADAFDKGKEAVFNSEDLEKLLDRSDLKRDSSDKENQNGKDNKSKIFKVAKIICVKHVSIICLVFLEVIWYNK